MVLGARLRTVMSSIIRWRKAETLPAGGIESAEGLLLPIARNGNGRPSRKPSWQHYAEQKSGQHTTGRSWQPKSTGRVSTFPDNAPGFGRHRPFSHSFRSAVRATLAAVRGHCELARLLPAVIPSATGRTSRTPLSAYP